MNRKQAYLILLGIITIISQSILLRELLVEVNGNEIVFAIYISTWLLFISIGSYFARYINQTDSISLVLLTFLLFCIPFQYYHIRDYAGLFRLVSGQIINIPALVLLGIMVLFPICIISGMLFPLLCKLLKKFNKPVYRGYILECIGIVLGSLVFAIFISFLPQFVLLCCISFLGFIILFFVERSKLLLIPIILLLVFMPFSHSIYISKYGSRYEGQELIASTDSPYGRLDITSCNGQKNYYWNGGLFATGENEIYAQQMVSFVMLQHPDPKRILLVGGLLNGFVTEMQNFDSITGIDYLEMDKNILQQSQPSEKLHFIRSDPVQYLKTTKKKYDMIFLDLPDPASLFLNRFYTEEFFRMVKQKFYDKNGVAAITLSSGTNFMTTEISSLNSSIFAAFSKIFSNVVIIPATKNIFIGSPGDYISNNVQQLQDRSTVQKTWFNDNVIFEICNQLRINQVAESILKTDSDSNRFNNPVAYLSTILLWTSINKIKLNDVSIFLKSNTAILAAIVVIMICLTVFIASYFANTKNTKNDYTIYSISLVNFVMELILINLFQMYYGYLYLMIFLFTTGFMVGLMLGFILHPILKISRSLLWVLNLALILILWLVTRQVVPAFLFFIFNLCFAFLEGLMLSGALNNKQKKITKGSSFYFMDSLGAVSGGIFIFVFFLPLAGFYTTLLLLMIIIILNLVLTISRQFAS